MTFLSLSWKCYWHSNDLLHVPVDYRAICQHFISLSINLSPASQTFTGMKFKQTQYRALIPLLLSVGASGADPFWPREGFFMTEAVVVCTGLELVCLCVSLGMTSCLLIWKSLGWIFFFRKWNRLVSQLLSWILSLGFQAVVLCLLCKKRLGWRRRCWPVLTSQCCRLTS